MTILHVNSLYQLGGAETVMRQLLRNFPDAEAAIASGKTFPHHVRALYPRPLAYLWHSRLHAAIERLFPRDHWTDRAFRRLAEDPRDLIHLHNFHGLYATLESLAALARAKPLVWTFHALWGVTGGCDHPRACRRYLKHCGECPQLNRWPLGPVDHTAAQLQAKLSLIAPLPLHIISPSRWMAEAIAQSPVGQNWRIHCIPNAVDTEFLQAAEKVRRQPAGRPSILIVNRNFRDEQKGFPIVQAALRESAGKLGGTAAARPKILLVGGDASWAAGELPAWECESHGYLSDPATLAARYAQADIFLFASPAENFPCVILEAMAAGACVVATPTGGVAEQIEHGVSGFLAPEISGPALAEALLRALASPDDRAAMVAAAKERVHRNYTEKVFTERHREVYAEALRLWKSAP